MKRREFIRSSALSILGANLVSRLLAETDFGFDTYMFPTDIGSARLNYLHGRITGMPPKEISFDHARIITRAYQQTEGQPLILRRARAFADVLDQIPIDIDQGELLVGNITARPRVSWFCPCSYRGWDNYEPGKPIRLVRKIFSDEIDVDCHVPEEVGQYWRNQPIGDTVGHFVADYERVLNLGFTGIIDEIETSRLTHARNGTLDAEKSAFFDAARLCAEAAIRYSERHADLAEAQAATTTDPIRKLELEEIAHICRRCPREPARTFHEAMQSFWMTHVLLHLSSSEWSVSPGRFDQYMFPFFDRDRKAGRLSREWAEELMTCLYIKFNEVRIDIDIISYQNLMVGGVDADGNDVTNELSYLCLETQKKIKGQQPSLSMRWHPGTPQRLLDLASEVILTGSGRPAMFGDPANIAALVNEGVPLELARNYSIAGCEEISVAGKTFGAARAGLLNNPRAVLNAIMDARRDFPDFDSVLAAYKVELAVMLRRNLLATTERDRRNGEHTPYPFTSLLFPDCLERGLDITRGGVAHNLVSISESGCVSAAEALYAIRQGVFKEKVFTLEQLREALSRDFEGYEWIRGYCWNRVPKFGNDRDDIDAFCTDIVEYNHECIEALNLTTYTGGHYIVGSGISSAWALGNSTPATPDGRKAGKSFSVSYGPSNGSDTQGPTAMLNSVAKLKWENQPGGALTHVRLPYSGSDNVHRVRNVSALIASFFTKGGMGCHFSVVDPKKLKDAIAEPENHLDLMVRIGGYSAPFCLLSPFMQREILERTEQSA